jgi:hypothetical protein
VTRINVYPLNFVRVQMLMSNGSDRYMLAPKPVYDVYSIPHVPDKAIKLLVRYDKKSSSGESVDYRSVMVSYDALAIYANQVHFDRKKFIVSAQGDVIVEDGTQRFKATNVTVRFNNGAPEIARKQD